MTAVLSGLTQPIEQEALLHGKQEIVEEYDHVKR